MDASRLSKIEQVFPYDGPHDVDTVTEAAEAVSHLVRYLNNATQVANTLPHVSSVDEVVNTVAEWLRRTDQLLNHLHSKLLITTSPSPSLYDDRRDGRNPYDTVDDGRMALLQARSRVQEAAVAVSEVTTHISHISEEPVR